MSGFKTSCVVLHFVTTPGLLRMLLSCGVLEVWCPREPKLGVSKILSSVRSIITLFVTVPSELWSALFHPIWQWYLNKTLLVFGATKSRLFCLVLEDMETVKTVWSGFVLCFPGTRGLHELGNKLPCGGGHYSGDCLLGWALRKLCHQRVWQKLFKFMMKCLCYSGFFFLASFCRHLFFFPLRWLWLVKR